MRLSLFLRAVLAAFALTLVQCKAFDETRLDPPDAGGPNCEIQRPPPRPEMEDDPVSSPTFTYAIRDLLMDQREGRWQMIGYDLDDLCSEGANPRVECLPPNSLASAQIDGVRGTDNALGATVFPILLLALPDFQEVARADQTKGVGVALIQIEGWNGEDEDPLVEVVFAQSAFGTTVQPDRVDSFGFDIIDRTLSVNGEPWPGPAWSGEDFWYARSDSFLEGDQSRPRIRDDNAYVSNGTVVMRLPDRFPIVFGGQLFSTTFRLSGATFTAKISDDRQTVERATLVGRFATLDILETIKTAGFCPGSDDYENLARLLDLAADIRTVPGTGGAGAVCDAVSVGLLYESGVAAQLGGTADPIVPAELCTDGGVPDGGTMDGGMDTSTPDSGPPDSGPPDALDAGVPDAPDV